MTRTPSDQVPDYECPGCGAVYAKAEMHMKRQEQEGARMGDENLYLKATREVDSDERNAALWAKVIVLTEGDAERARIQYIKLRVAQFAKEDSQDGVGEKHLPRSFDMNNLSQSGLPSSKSGHSLLNHASFLSRLTRIAARHRSVAIGVFVLAIWALLALLLPVAYDLIDRMSAARYLEQSRLAAEQGSSDAAFNLGDYFYYGRVGKQDFKEAKKWYLLAAKLGNPKAQSALSNAQHMEAYVATDYCKEARKWLRHEAERGDAIAQARLERGGNEVAQGCAKEAGEWLRQAAENGDAVAQAQLGHESASDPEAAIKWYRRAAEQGNTDAQVKLGEIYDYGYSGVAQDYSEAIKWYRLAAEQGDAIGQMSIGLKYGIGDGVAKDDAEAVKWYYQAAKQGNAHAQSFLGSAYKEGTGVNQNFPEAAKWYRLAAEKGDLWAQTELGILYLKGQGVTQDYKEAARWLLPAAEAGFTLAAYNIGMMYLNGQGVAKDSKEAIGWLRLAAVAGDPNAREALDKLGVDGR